VNDGRFKVTLKGDEADDSLRLSDLIDQLAAIKQVLNHIDKRISDRKSPGLYYRITAISMNSPVTLEVEAVSKQDTQNYGPQVVDRFGRDIQQVIRGHRPEDADFDLLEAYKLLVQPLKRHMSQFIVQIDNDRIDIPKSLDAKVDAILGPDQVERGSITGSLDVLDIHAGKNLFKVYPVVGPSSVKCHFAKGMLKKAVSGIDHFVKISGELHYKKAEKFPHFVEVDHIEVLLEQADIPKLSSMRGMAKDAYDGLSSTDYIDKIRNGDW
jgi:hypothetical protein